VGANVDYVQRPVLKHVHIKLNSDLWNNIHCTSFKTCIDANIKESTDDYDTVVVQHTDYMQIIQFLTLVCTSFKTGPEGNIDVWAHTQTWIMYIMYKDLF
jgi:hypothetical protein